MPRWLRPWVVLYLFISPLPSFPNPIELPDIGASDSLVISAEEEAAIGRDLLRSLRRAGKLVEDPELEEYINTLGFQLLSSTHDAAGRPFNFFLVDDPAINAFAAPGGQIGVNTGLIIASRNEGELAAVLSHEIAHVTQRHLTRGGEQASRANTPLTAAVVAALVLGSYNPQLAQAAQMALVSSIAGAEQMRLEFSRTFEQEADRVGIGMLAQAGFDPEAMPAFFERLGEENKYAESAPEFLSTHPVTVTRIADSRNRADQMPHGSRGDSLNYELVKAELRLRAGREPKALLDEAQSELAREGPGSLPRRYLYARAMARSGDMGGSIKELEKLVDKSPGTIMFYTALAGELRESGRGGEALEVYRRGLRLYPRNLALVLGAAELSLQQGAEQQAEQLLMGTIRQDPTAARPYKLLAELEMKRGRPVEARLRLADYYVRIGERRTAIEQLQFAQKEPNLDFYYASRVDARLKELMHQRD